MWFCDQEHVHMIAWRGFTGKFICLYTAGRTASECSARELLGLLAAMLLRSIVNYQLSSPDYSPCHSVDEFSLSNQLLAPRSYDVVID